MYRISSFFFLLLVIPGISARAQSTMSLSDCISYAVQNHPSVQTAMLQTKDAEWQLKENTAIGLPQFSAGASYQHFFQAPALPAEALGFSAPPGTKIAFQLTNSISGNLQYSQLLFSNSYLLAIKASRYYREYVQIQLAAAKATVRNQVVDAYLPSLLISDNLSILDKNLANLEQLLSETKAINKAGFAEQLDVDRLELSLATLRSERDNLVRQQEVVVDALKFAMGYPVTESLQLSDNLEQLLSQYADVDLTTQVNYSNRPEYTQLLKGRELSQIQVDLYKKPYLPVLSGFIQAQGSYQGNDKLFWIPSAVAGLNLSLPIWDGGATKARKERAMISAQNIDIQRGMLENAINLEVEGARKSYLNALARVSNQEKNLDLATRIYETTQKKYKAGVGSSFELVSSEQQVYSAQQALMEAQYDLLTARIAVKKALGML